METAAPGFAASGPRGGEACLVAIKTTEVDGRSDDLAAIAIVGGRAARRLLVEERQDHAYDPPAH